MRLAILADIHGNLEALEAVLIAASQAGAERVVSLGDVVGYGADAARCIYRLVDAEAVSILGNHDHAVLDPGQIQTFNYAARQSLLDARATLQEDAIAYLRRAAYRRVEHGGVLVHAHPVCPEEWELLFSYDSIVAAATEMDFNLAFYGHTHHSAIYCHMRGRVVRLTSQTVAIGPHRYLINPGSVGQPRDGDWRAAFALWDLGRQVVELRRVEYALEKAQARMLAAGRPRYQVERIARGE